jgi:hypothetical protein
VENKRESLSVKPQPAKAGKSFKIAALAAVFAIAALAAVFLFAGSTKAQNIRQFAAPRFACQAYRGQQGFSIVRDLEHDCLVKTGNGQVVAYTHFFDSGSNFCFEVTSTQGQIIAPQCIPISQTGRVEQQRQEEQQQNSKPKIATPPAFQIRELQYDTLPTGRKIEAGENERIEIAMPDGSLIQLDANATFTPVSDHEVHSVFGRYRYLWQPFHDGKCIVGQNLVRQDCRRVRTQDAVLGDRGTEFLVESDKSGTLVTVLDGTVIATDLAGKKTVEVPAGQSTYIKHGSLPEEPKSFDPAKIERWWEKKTSKQISQTVIGITVIAAVIIIVFSLLVSIIKRIFRRKKPVPAVAPAVGQINQNMPAAEKSDSQIKKKKHHPAFLILIIFILLLGPILAFYLIKSSYSGDQKEKNSEIEKSIAEDERLKDPDLLYASFSSYGLCRNDKGEEGGCSTKKYLYLSGKFITVSGWTGIKDKTETSTNEKQLGKDLIGKVSKQIKDSGLMAKTCDGTQAIDASWRYQISLDGVKKEFRNPPDSCKNTFDAIDGLINSAVESNK